MAEAAVQKNEKVKFASKVLKPDSLMHHMFKTLSENGAVDIEFITQSYITKPEIIKLPAFAVTINFTANWSASFGYSRTEHYTEYVRVHKNGSSYMEPRTRKKTVTDWRPVSGIESGQFTLLCYAGKKHPAAKSLAPTFAKVSSEKFIDRNELVETAFYNVESILKGHQETIEFNINQFVKSNSQGDKQKDWKISSESRYLSEEYSFPLYMSHIVYRGKKEKLYFSASSAGRYIFNKFERDKVDDSFDAYAKNTRIFVAAAIIISSILLGTLGLIPVIMAGSFWRFANNCIKSIKSEDSSKMAAALEARSKLGFVGEESTIKNYDSGPEAKWRTPKGKKQFTIFAVLVVFLSTLISFYQAYQAVAHQSTSLN